MLDHKIYAMDYQTRFIIKYLHRSLFVVLTHAISVLALCLQIANHAYKAIIESFQAEDVIAYQAFMTLGVLFVRIALRLFLDVKPVQVLLIACSAWQIVRLLVSIRFIVTVR